MKNQASIFFITGLIVCSLSLSVKASQSENNANGGDYTLTVKKLTPKQFTKGYKAERIDYKIQKNTSVKKMKRRLKGNWLQRWFSRNY
jgi:hypothetical protein